MRFIIFYDLMSFLACFEGKSEVVFVGLCRKKFSDEAPQIFDLRSDTFILKSIKGRTISE